MRPAHWEVAGKDLVEDLVELGLNESNESGLHILLQRRLCLEAGVDFIYSFEDRCEL